MLPQYTVIYMPPWASLACSWLECKIGRAAKRRWMKTKQN